MLLVTVLGGCGSHAGPGGPAAACKPGLPTADECPAAAPSYATVIGPLVEERCLSCHFTGNPNSSVVLETQAELHAQTQLVETQVYRCSMPPPEDAAPLADTERQELLQWLVCNAPNN